VNLLLLNFQCYCLHIGLDILKLNELTVSCSLMSSLIAPKTTGHVITATYKAECPPRQFVFLLRACQHNQRYPSHYELQYYTPPAYPQLTYLCTRYRNALLGITGLPSFSSLASISYRLLIGPHSPSRPTAATRCSFDLVFADLHSDLWQKRHVWHRWPKSCMCCSFVLIRRAGPLVRIARLPSFSLLAYLSYAFRICSHSPLPTARKRCSSALIILVGQHLVPVARRPSFSTLAYCSYAFRVCSYSPLPTARTHCSFDLNLLAGYIFYELLVCPYSPRWPTSCTRCSSALMRHRMCPVRRD